MKLLIIKPSSLGDIIHALVVVQAIKAQRPEAHITWVARDLFAPLLLSTPIVDRIIIFERKKGLGGLKSFIRLLREIHAERYDAVLEMQGLFRSGLMAWAARAPLKIGRRDGREGAQLFVNKLVALPKESLHAVDKLMEFLPLLGLKPLYAPLTPRANATSPELPQGTILIFPSARGKWANKEWPYFKELTERLLKEGKTVAWCSDQPLETPPGALNFCAGVRLQELLPFIAQARLVVSNDSGPVHGAAALGVPVLALFGPTDPALVGPYPPDKAQNKFLKSASQRMEDITVAEVMGCVERMIKPSSQ